MLEPVPVNGTSSLEDTCSRRSWCLNDMWRLFEIYILKDMLWHLWTPWCFREMHGERCSIISIVFNVAICIYVATICYNDGDLHAICFFTVYHNWRMSCYLFIQLVSVGSLIDTSWPAQPLLYYIIFWSNGSLPISFTNAPAFVSPNLSS